MAFILEQGFVVYYLYLQICNNHFGFCNCWEVSLPISAFSMLSLSVCALAALRCLLFDWYSKYLSGS